MDDRNLGRRVHVLDDQQQLGGLGRHAAPAQGGRAVLAADPASGVGQPELALVLELRTAQLDRPGSGQGRPVPGQSGIARALVLQQGSQQCHGRVLSSRRGCGRLAP